ncbi:MAG TPA: phosphoribosylanthranilate isomerase [Thermoanaerobaculia bacterium]|jgi:phosphoribosylanthranilate isomerase|nr:phosphoribosylanthranilate isomerase [Thermoanaerobaculia bacterium]
MTKIKICGITREEDAMACADQRADFLGFIFVPGTPRFIEPERAAEIALHLRERESRPKLVGVFRDASNDYIREIAALVGFDLVQLHGRESDEDIHNLGIPVIRTLRVGDTLPDTHAFPNAAWLLFDTYDERRIGGTGRRFDWSLLAIYDRSKPFFLSGGLDPDNVVAAISLVRPDAIDLSSGLESEPGIKDHDAIARLFERVRRA